MTWLRRAGLVLALAASTVVAKAEDALVSSGLTIADNLVASANGGVNVEYTTALTSAFTTAVSDNTVTVAHTAHGYSTGQKISFADTSPSTIGGLNMDEQPFTVATVPNANSYTFEHPNAASGNATNTGSTNETASALGQDGKLRFFCFGSHVNYDDPIKNPNQRGAAHLHMFFGNTLTDYTSTYSSLRSGGNGTCDGGPLNRTGYWAPAMINSANNKYKWPDFFEWYYQIPNRNWLAGIDSARCATTGLLNDGRPIACPTLPVRRLQRGQKAIFGFDPSGLSAGTPGTGGYPTSYAGNDFLENAWGCHNTSGVQQGAKYRYLHHRTNASLGLTSNGSCPADGQISVVLSTPNCWDGELDDPDDHYNHFSIPGGDGSGTSKCPASHPYLHIVFTTLIHWNYTGGFAQVANWHLSSDRHNGADYEAGETWHWDMQFAWEDDIMEHWASKILGMSPDPTHASPYVLESAGNGWAGGQYMRNTNNGGLGLFPCDALGFVGKCALKSHTLLGGLTDVEVDVPANPGPVSRRGRSRSRMR